VRRSCDARRPWHAILGSPRLSEPDPCPDRGADLSNNMDRVVRVTVRNLSHARGVSQSALAFPSSCAMQVPALPIQMPASGACLRRRLDDYCYDVSGSWGSCSPTCSRLLTADIARHRAGPPPPLSALGRLVRPRFEMTNILRNLWEDRPARASLGWLPQELIYRGAGGGIFAQGVPTIPPICAFQSAGMTDSGAVAHGPLRTASPWINHIINPGPRRRHRRFCLWRSSPAVPL